MAVLSTTTASRACTSGDVLRSRSRLSRSRISSSVRARSMASPFCWCSRQRRSARISGDAVRKIFSSASGNTTRADVAPFHHHAALVPRAALLGHQHVAHAGDGGHFRCALRNLRLRIAEVTSSPSSSTCCVPSCARRSILRVAGQSHQIVARIERNARGAAPSARSRGTSRPYRRRCSPAVAPRAAPPCSFPSPPGRQSR